MEGLVDGVNDGGVDGVSNGEVDGEVDGNVDGLEDEAVAGGIDGVSNGEVDGEVDLQFISGAEGRDTVAILHGHVAQPQPLSDDAPRELLRADDAQQRLDGSRLEELLGDDQVVALRGHRDEVEVQGPGLGGFFLTSEYEESVAGEPSYAGHGVYGYDEEAAKFTMHWFDSMGGSYVKPALGGWDGNSLSFENVTPQGHARYTHTLEGDEYHFKIEVAEDGEAWTMFMAGSYQRI